MTGDGNIVFGPFRLDPARRLLHRPDATVALRPKTQEVLRLLLRHAGSVVAKDEILAGVWPDVAVSEYVLTTCVSELRAALGDDARRARFLVTVHRTGYQLDAGLAVADPAAPGEAAAIVGRVPELRQLHAALRRAAGGARQVVFLTGEMGIGKTTLAAAFLRRAEAAAAPAAGTPLVAHGQCIEQFGAGEPYMPVFEAIARLGRTRPQEEVVDVLRLRAPSWLVRIPGLLPAAESAALRRELPAETREHMLRSIAEGIEAIAESQLLVLFLEDLHLSDHATLELLNLLALRRGPARLLLLGTFRSGEEFPAATAFRSLAQQLLLHRQCEEIAVPPLSPDAVASYLDGRFAGLDRPRDLVGTLHERTEGNPLFLARLVDFLVESGAVGVDHGAARLRVEAADVAGLVPANLRAMIEQRADALDAAEREVLETASVGGILFWSSSVAAALGSDREAVETTCARLARRHGFLVEAGETASDLPDLGGRYGFRHALYHQVLYERLEPTRRQRLHRLVGGALRSAWGGRAGEVAAELASHFDRGGEPALAIDFYDQAAIAAAARGANREATQYLDRGLGLLARLDDGPERRQRRLDLYMTRGPALLASVGYGGDAVVGNYEQALDLARGLGNPVAQISCLLALSIARQTRGDLEVGEALARELVGVGEAIGLPPPLLAQLHNPLSQARLYQGHVVEALALADAAVAGLAVMAMPPPPAESRPALWAEPSVMLHCQRGAASVAHGRLARAGEAVAAALGIAHDLQHPFNLAYASSWAALFEDTLGRWDEAERLAAAGMTTADAWDLPFWGGVARIFRGHALARRGDVRGGVDLLREGVAVWSGTGAALARSMYMNLLADALLLGDDVDGADAALADAAAHAQRTGEAVFLPETLRLSAECRRRRGGDAASVAAALAEAIELAGRHGSKLWELRAATTLHSLRGTAASRRALAAACEAFAAEPPEYDVAAARDLLAG